PADEIRLVISREGAIGAYSHPKSCRYRTIPLIQFPSSLRRSAEAMSDGNLTAASPRWLLPARWFRSWKLWEVPRSARGLLLAVELASIVGLVSVGLGFHLNGTDVG